MDPLARPDLHPDLLSPRDRRGMAFSLRVLQPWKFSSVLEHQDLLVATWTPPSPGAVPRILQGQEMPPGAALG